MTYDIPWQNAFHTALSKIIAAGVSACRNIRQLSPDCDVPVLPEIPPTAVLLSFVALLERNINFLFLYFVLTSNLLRSIQL